MLGITLASFVLMLFYLINGVDVKQSIQKPQGTIQQQEAKKQILGFKTQKENNVWPVRLIIPIINVDTAIEDVGVTSQGAMDVPNNTNDVGWFDLGPRPGEKGSAVIAGHFDGKNGEAGVFINLSKLKEGNKLYVENNNGKYITFVVQESHTYTPGYQNDVFSRNDGAHLNLITCDGVWNNSQKSYSKRLVVFADLANKP